MPILLGENEFPAMPPWRMAIELFEAIANKHPRHFTEINKIVKYIILCHYEEIYGYLE